MPTGSTESACAPAESAIAEESEESGDEENEKSGDEEDEVDADTRSRGTVVATRVPAGVSECDR
jgi:hypothetical protein